MDQDYLKKIVENALEEDVGKGDITAKMTIPEKAKAKAVIYSKEKGIVCGLDVAGMVFTSMDPGIKFKKLVKDGDPVKANQNIAEIKGNARAILAGERTALNFLQRLSGVSTTTRKYVDAVKPCKVRILDTRKTTPGLRLLEKYAVRKGGGFNHRLGLWDAILIKDNHIKIAGLKNAIRLAKKSGRKTETEVENLKELKDALEAKADIIMLDNMGLSEIKKAVKIVNKKAIIEVSGGIDLENVREIAKTGVDWISAGRLTYSVKALDIAMRILP
jgi:nicotinate-nucleotide pyrophosphorylase (carboxylating)